MELETTLDNWTGYNPERNSGNTTRLIDHAIQILFSGKVCVCLDHFQNGMKREANLEVFEGVIKRLKAEHSHYLIHVDKNNLQISIERNNLRLKNGKSLLTL
jgi:hypothetical protein